MPDPASWHEHAIAWRHAANDAEVANEVAALRESPRNTPYRLATLTYAWGYFGLNQAIDLDSIRFAIDVAHEGGEFNQDDRDWCLAALLRTACQLTGGPGHFAQYLSGRSASGLERLVRQRRRSPWVQFLRELDQMRPHGSRAWRNTNRVFTQDALELLTLEEMDSLNGSVVYADPPYTRDHYSRYYHVLESLTLYDYPRVEAQGRYRDDRFRTPFSLKTEVSRSFRSLLAAIAEAGASAVISYPSNGLLYEADPGLRRSLRPILREYFPSVRLAARIRASHSTFGARHGQPASNAVECIWVAAGAR
jgi:adenine-specific DNA-methyltransferase